MWRVLHSWIWLQVSRHDMNYIFNIYILAMVASGDFVTTSKNLDLFPPVRSKHDSKADGFCWKLDTCWRFCMQPSIAQWIVQHNVSLDPAVFQFILVSNMFSDKMRGTRNRHSFAGSTPNNCQVFFVLTILQHPFKSIRIAGCRIVSAGVFANIFFFSLILVQQVENWCFGLVVLDIWDPLMNGIVTYLGVGFQNVYFHPYLGKISNLTNIFQLI